jgi:Zn-dependent peptidase ImmA (M78 family)
LNFAKALTASSRSTNGVGAINNPHVFSEGVPVMVQRTDVQHTIDRARKLIVRFQKSAGAVDVIQLARQFGIHSVESARLTADGYLGRQHDGTMVIRYRSANPTTRNRFTVVHELAHMLLAEVQGKPLLRAEADYASDAEEETAVNRIAAELLMPATFIVDELARRQRDGDRPCWRTVHALSKMYSVSASAMALRLLELPTLHAISLRINIEGVGSRFPFDRSEGCTIRLLNGIEFEMERLWRQARESTRHTVPVRIQTLSKSIACEGSVKSLSTRRGWARFYWVIGWDVTADGRVGRPTDSVDIECHDTQ